MAEDKTPGDCPDMVPSEVPTKEAKVPGASCEAGAIGDAVMLVLPAVSMRPGCFNVYVRFDGSTSGDRSEIGGT